MSAEYNAKFANTDIATRAIHAGQEPDPTTGAVVTPIFATSTFKQDGVLGLRGGHDYSRSINPTRTSFDEQLAAVRRQFLDGYEHLFHHRARHDARADALSRSV